MCAGREGADTGVSTTAARAARGAAQESQRGRRRGGWLARLVQIKWQAEAGGASNRGAGSGGQLIQTGLTDGNAEGKMDKKEKGLVMCERWNAEGLACPAQGVRGWRGRRPRGAAGGCGPRGAKVGQGVTGGWPRLPNTQRQ